jgi:hypothetical protein
LPDTYKVRSKTQVSYCRIDAEDAAAAEDACC